MKNQNLKLLASKQQEPPPSWKKKMQVNLIAVQLFNVFFRAPQ